MKKDLSWKITLPLGLGLIVVANVIGRESIIADALGTIGLIVFLLGLVNGIIALVKYNKKLRQEAKAVK